jgi:hypothetical protein
MKIIELTSARTGLKIAFFVTGNITVAEIKEEGKTLLNDGNHNNGGWMVKESYEEVIKKLKEA